MSQIVVANTDSNAVDTILNQKLIPILQGEPLATAAAAMLMLIVISMRPLIDENELAAVVTETSAFISTRLSDSGLVN